MNKKIKAPKVYREGQKEKGKERKKKKKKKENDKKTKGD